MSETSLTDPSKGLSPIERRIALLRSADMSIEAIARVMNTSSMAVGAVLNRPHVQKYLLAVGATFADDIRETAARVNKSIINQTEAAVTVVTTLMTDMFAQRNEVPKAKLAFAAAQDILDRAGATAPKRFEIDEHHEHSIDPETLKGIADVLKEMS